MEALELERIEELVEQALEDLRPYLKADEGDITLEEVTQQGIVKVRLHGSCVSCSMSPMTLRAGVEEAIKKLAPNVIGVEAVNVGD
jgi:Fe-S cluster biogenesis protein NfuA